MKSSQYSLIIVSVFFWVCGNAQDPEFTQVMATPAYFNPAFAGIQQNIRAGLQYRNQWLGEYTTLAASADMGLNSISSGVGLMLMNDDQAGYPDLTSNTINAYYAYEIKTGNKSNLRFGLNPSLFQRSIDFGTPPPFGSQGQPTGIIKTKILGNVSAGALFYTSDFYGGIAVYNIPEPNETFFNNNAPLPRRYDLQAGYYWGSNRFFINPYVLVMHQQNFTQALFGANLTMGMFMFGASFRQTDPNADAYQFMVGFAKGIFKICYSYDHTISDIAGPAPGSHELSVVFQFNKPNDISEKPMIQHLRNSY